MDGFIIQYARKYCNCEICVAYAYHLCYDEINHLKGDDIMEKYQQLTFGAAKELITPRERTMMIGFGAAFGVPFTDIHDDLYVRTLLLQDDDGETVLLIAMDLLFHDDSLPIALRAYAEKTHGVKPDNLHVSYTHTHFGPAVKGYDFNWTADSYEAFLFDRICACIDRAFLTTRRGTLKYAAIGGEWNCSRRLMVDGVMQFRANPEGEVDKNLYLLKLEDEEGRMRALAANFACHPSNLDHVYNIISSEYAGRLCQKIEGAFYGCTALFFQGFGADAKLRKGMKTSLFRQISFDECDEVASAMLGRIQDKLINGRWETLPVQLGSRVFRLTLPLEINPREFYVERSTYYSKQPGARYVREINPAEDLAGNGSKLLWSCADYVLDHYDELPEVLELNCGVVKINPGFFILSMGGEPVINIRTVLCEAFPDRTLLTFGYNDAIAYIPSDKVIGEGGYEADGSVTEYRLKGRIAPGVDEIYRRGFGAVMDELK